MTGPDSASAWLRHALVALAMALGAGLSAPARADQVFTVGSTLDQIDDDVSDGLCHTAAGTCTLRAAIMQANHTSGVGATIIVPAGVYTLTRPRTPSGGELDGDLDLTTPANGNPVIRIVGAGKSTTIIDANQIDRVLSIAANRSATISALTIRNGFSTGDGGGLNATLDSTVTLQDVAISGNTSLAYGGGIRSAGTLTMRDSVISGNASSTSGGGIHSNGVLSVDKTVFSGNTAGSAMGGGISQLHGTLTVRKSRLLSNHAVFGAGISQNNGYVTIEDSTLEANVATRDGGGIYAIAAMGQLRVKSSAIVANNANNGAGLHLSMDTAIVNTTIAANNAVIDGGGILVRSTNVGLYNSTIAGNMANADPSPDWSGSGGGILVYQGTVNLRNTIVASNYTSGAPIPDDCSGLVNSYGRNLFGSTDRCTVTTMTGSWDLLSWDSFGGFGDNGGPTPTYALNAGSNAIDAGTLDGGCRDDQGPLPTDQRGLPRVGACDIGAFEYGAVDPDRIFKTGFE